MNTALASRQNGMAIRGFAEGSHGGKLPVSATVMFLLFAASLAALQGILFEQGLVGYGQQLNEVVILTCLIIWIYRKAGGFYVATALIAVRVATVLISTAYIEPYYLAWSGSDADIYHAVGMEISRSIMRDGTIPATGLGWGTENCSIYTGLCYILFGPNRLVAKLVNTGLGAIGAILFYRGYVSYYQKPNRALQLLLFFSPALLYWSSIQGKDPLMFCFLGLGFWGAATLAKQGSLKSFITCLLATGGLFWIRPYMACLYMAALSILLIVRRGPYKKSRAILKLAPVLTLVLVYLSAGFVAREYGNLEGPSDDAAVSQLSNRLNGLGTGGSAIDVPTLGGFKSMITYFPSAAATVLFRPLPWEGGNLFFALTSLDQLVLTVAVLVFAVLFLRNLRRNPSRVRPGEPRRSTDPLTLFLAAYCVGFVLLMAYLTMNLGTLAREKIQFIPFVLCGAFALASRHGDSRIANALDPYRNGDRRASARSPHPLH